MPDLISLEDEWRKGWRAAGKAYAETNKAGYDAIWTEVSKKWSGEPGSYRRLMSECQYKCALAAGFPDWPTFRALHEVPA